MANMRKAGVKADTIHYNTVIMVSAEAHDMKRAEHWMSKMRKAGVKTDAFCYSTMIKASAEEHDMDELNIGCPRC